MKKELYGCKATKGAFILAEGRLASTTTQAAAKEARSTIKNTLAPCGRGQNLLANECELGEGSYQCDKTDMTPHQGRPACTNTLATAKEVRSTSSLAILSRKGRGMRAAFTLAEGRLACTTTQVAAKAAFTLAEVLITLAVIGIVAALTLPGLIKNHNEKAWSTAKDLWEKKLTETVRRMNIDGVMTGHDTTEDFMNTFKNYMKVIKTCDNNDINKCYAPKVVRTGSESEPEEIQTSDLKTAENLGNDWGTNTMSFVVTDGTTAIFAYNPNCAYADPIEDTGSQVSCLAYMVDVNGKKGPNRVTQDIALVGQIALSNCDNPIGDMCWSTDFAPTAINTCSDGTEEDKTYDPTGDSNSYCITNYWAGAKKACQNMGMSLPARAQLAQLASELYVSGSGEAVTVASGSSVYPLVLKPKYATDPPITIGRSYWSSSQYNVNEAYTRQFTSTGTYAAGCDYPKNQSHRRAVCLGS